MTRSDNEALAANDSKEASSFPNEPQIPMRRQLQTIAEEAFGERPSESLRKKGVQVQRSVRRSFF